MVNIAKYIFSELLLNLIVGIITCVIKMPNTIAAIVKYNDKKINI